MFYKKFRCLSSIIHCVKECIEMLATLSTFRIYLFAPGGEKVAMTHAKVSETRQINAPINYFGILMTHVNYV